jgi:putative phosphoesterase
MRIAIVSDIHGNLAAFDAVLDDLARERPDRILHAGDLAAVGPRPVEVVDRVRELGWEGVAGNWDLVFQPGGAGRIGDMPPRFQALYRPLVEWTRERLSPARIAWLAELPRERWEDDFVLLHAGPADLWSAPLAGAPDEVLLETYRNLGSDLVIYAHIHQPFVRHIGGLTIANSGSVGLPYDGDPRASYVLIEDGVPAVRRVAYDVEREIHDLTASGFPAAAQTAPAQRTGTYIQPP